MSSVSENIDDRLSVLPDEILSHILSLMPTKFAVRTSILSKRWRYTWTLVTNLDFDDTQGPPYNANIFKKFVNRVFKFCKTSHVKSFRLHISYNQYMCLRSSVSNWIDKAIGLTVRELDICGIQHELPLSLFTCNTLTNFRLDLSDCDYQYREFPSQIYLPCLKTLDIVGYCGPFIHADKFIRGCPVLESLSLEVSSNDEQDCVIKIPTLKWLKLVYSSATNVYNNKIVLRVPKLEYLFVGGILCSFFVMEDVSSLVGASIACWSSIIDYMPADLLNKVRGVQTLAIEDFPFASPLPVFPNLKKVELNGVWQFGQITQFLESCPELETFCIDFVGWRGVKPEELGQVKFDRKSIPACLLTKLTAIKFSKCDGDTWDMEFLDYMLGNAHVLKTVTVYAQENLLIEEHPFYAQVLKIPRASPHCEIHFRRWILPPPQEPEYEDPYEAYAF
ncbi:putative F-box/FBD/LRR-repeat protein At2g05300 [Bidens hawaiensis]|uniref:putative F-box/FBD/LRR-repeat protein At2g05300 n=1 Tax=Bidens hawaiensis TaxID=980011 RepID=UPI00404B4EB1